MKKLNLSKKSPFIFKLFFLPSAVFGHCSIAWEGILIFFCIVAIIFIAIISGLIIISKKLILYTRNQKIQRDLNRKEKKQR